MTALLIPCVMILLTVVFLCRRGSGIGSSVLKASLVVMLVIVVSTELLSRRNAIGFIPLVLLWWVVFAGAAAILLHMLRRRGGLRRLRRKMTRLYGGPRPTVRAGVFAVPIALVLLCTILVAVWQYPYDNDAVCYHMSRVANWINRGNVDFYPTVNQRQNFYAPGSAYAMLHIQLLTGSDKYSVMPQYVGMLLCFMLVAMLASRLRLGRTGEWFTVALAATIPILIGQSHCNQNELVLSAFLLGFMWFLMRFALRPDWPGALWCGGAFGLALLAKGSAFVYAAAIGIPFGVLAILRAVRRRGAWQRVVLQLTVAMLLGLALTAPFVARCSRDGSSYLKNEYTSELRNTRMSWEILRANAIRNAAVHVGRKDAEWNACIEKWVRDAVGKQYANGESTFRSLPFRILAKRTCFFATNPFHLALVLLAWVLVALVKHVPRGLLAAYWAASVLGALLFNLCLKWQYWGVRLQLPWLLLSMPLVAVVFFRVRLPDILRQALQLIVAVALFAGAVPMLLFEEELPLLRSERAPLVFRDAESIRLGSKEALLNGKSDYSRVADFLRSVDPDEVGLLLQRDNSGQDYNWWVAFGTHASRGRPRIRHVGPDVWPVLDAAAPEWVVSRPHCPESLEITGLRYKKVFQSGGSSVYRREQSDASCLRSGSSAGLPQAGE